VTLADFGYPVYALWFFCSQKLLFVLAFAYFGFEVIPQTRRAR
jgi:hypothetical protein